MIEILNINDMKRVKDDKLKNYLTYSFNRIPDEFDYPELGYFTIIEDIKELKSDFIQLDSIKLKGINNGLYDDINMVEVKDEIMEILVFVDNDISVSLILPIEILEDMHKERLLTYKI